MYHGNYGHHSSGKKTWKKTVWAVISLTDGEDDDSEVVGTYYISSKATAEAIDETVGLDLFEGVIEEDKIHKLPDGHDTIPHLFIDQKKVPTYISKNRGVACCAYNATNEFMKHWLGRQLDRHDNNWYKLNSLVTEHGLPQAHSFTVIQQLAEPYGAGVSRIIVPRNSRRFDEHQAFMLALGANPFFMADGKTSNEEAYAILYPEPVLAKMNLETPLAREQHKKDTFSTWRFECDDQPFRGAIIMRQFQHQSAGHNGGSNYIGVRDTADVENWWMAIKLDETDKINYQRKLEIPEYEEWAGAATYRWGGIKDATGRTLNQIEADIRKRKFSPKGKGGKTTALVPRTSPPPPPKGQRDLWPGRDDDTDDAFFGNSALGDSDSAEDEKIWAYAPICQECGKAPGDNVYVNDKRACKHCGTEVELKLIGLMDLLDGWEPLELEDVLGLDDLPPEADATDELPEYDPYFWGRSL